MTKVQGKSNKNMDIEINFFAIIFYERTFNNVFNTFEKNVENLKSLSIN